MDALTTVGDLIVKLQALDPKLTIGVQTSGCCYHAHGIDAVELSSTISVREYCHQEADVVIRAS